MELEITADRAPALGDVRQLGRGDTLRLRAGWMTRADWLRYLAAAAHAVARGARVHQGADHG